jgi:predicted oxidoreductase (fatty acid repression mutant protein)
MRFIVLKTQVTEKSLDILGLVELSQKSSGVFPKWIDIKEAKTDCTNPEKCDLLSFEDEEVVKDLVENFGEETIAYIGVDA